MFYREAGDFKTSYADDSQTFPIAFDRYRYYFVLAVGLGIIPFVITDNKSGEVNDFNFSHSFHA